jgi:hypothetical protein
MFIKELPGGAHRYKYPYYVAISHVSDIIFLAEMNKLMSEYNVILFGKRPWIFLVTIKI